MYKTEKTPMEWDETIDMYMDDQ